MIKDLAGVINIYDYNNTLNEYNLKKMKGRMININNIYLYTYISIDIFIYNRRDILVEIIIKSLKQFIIILDILNRAFNK